MSVAYETARELFEAARLRWPNIPLSAEAFSRRLDALVRDEPEPDAAARSRATHDLYLSWACLEGIPQAYVEFERAYLTQVPLWVKRIVRSEARADEVRQEVAKRLLTSDGDSPPRLASYSGKGSLIGWVRVAATRVAQNIRASQHSQHGVAFEAEHAPPDMDAELAALRKLYAKQFADALRSTLRTLERDERVVLRLHYLDGLSIEDVGAAYRVSRATAARMLARARERVVAKMQELLAQELGAAAPEAASFIAMIRNELEASLATRLSEEG